jgi:leucyl-tRNA synthetase
MMEFTNFMADQEVRPISVLEQFTLLLAPFAPHLAEELWAALGHNNSLAYEPWPIANPSLLIEDSVEIPIQISGKLRGKIVVPAGLDAAALEAAAKADEQVRKYLDGKTIVRVVCVPGRLVNFVVR